MTTSVGHKANTWLEETLYPLSDDELDTWRSAAHDREYTLAEVLGQRRQPGFVPHDFYIAASPQCTFEGFEQALRRAWWHSAYGAVFTGNKLAAEVIFSERLACNYHLPDRQDLTWHRLMISGIKPARQ